MKKNTTLFFILAIIIVGGALLIFNRNTATSGALVSPKKEMTPESAKSDYTIKMTPDGFSPEEITIKKGQTITWINETDEFGWPASNLHPTHGIYPEFDPQEPVAPGESWSFTFEKVGTWHFHDHLRPRFFGKINVEE